MKKSQELLQRIEAFLVNHNISATAFGRFAMNDDKIVFNMRNGRCPSLDNAQRMIEYMDKRDANSTATA